MEYFGARWLHNDEDDPVVLWHEVGDDRLEARKVHEFRDGTLERTDRIQPEKRTSLSWTTLPLVDEIQVQPDFEVFPLTADQFEAVWQSAHDA